MKMLISLPVFIIFFGSISFAVVQNNFKRLIVFGDSLSDVGTYSKTAGASGGGKFTNNPGKIWIENVATDLGLSMKTNRYEGYGVPTQLAGGLNYAQGGARVATDLPLVRDSGRPTARSIATQVQYYIQQYRQFQLYDLVIVQGGANDLFAQIKLLKEGKVTPESALTNMTLAANQLNEIIKKIKTLNAQTVFVANLPMVQKTPFGLAMPAQMQSLIEKMVLTFNAQLLNRSRSSNARLLDIYSFELAMTNNYAKYGIKNITQPGCNLQALPGGSSLYCTKKTLVEVGAETTFKYADMVHPSNIYYLLVGKFALNEILRPYRR